MTVSDVISAATPEGNPASADPTAGGARARVRARLADTNGDGNLASRVSGWVGAVRADVAGAWIWRGTPPAVADLWHVRVPSLERVPGQNPALRAAWAVYNHAALALFCPLAVALWVLQHPARLLLAAPIVVALTAMWIS
jgi:hypothetical protein